MPDSVIETISKLPATPSIVYRGMSGHPPTASFTVTALLPTSADPRVATENFTADRVAAIVSVTGRSIAALSRHPEEQETVILPATLLMPVGSVEVAGLPEPVVLLAETGWAPGLPENKDELGRVVVAHVAEALARPPVAVSSPGRFTPARS
ncbi:hypothetical protein [Mycolicibacterium sp.]|uniref:hypothetical protein n=1 Tax=Mycolicibacterium sp. TaxID=2320850 RepID=UPI003D0BCFAC